MRLGVAIGGHVHAFPDLLRLVRRAEALGFDAAFVDGDDSMLVRRPETEVLDGWTVTTALLAQTHRIAIGSVRLVHHWNAARLAQAVATAEALFPGRLRFLLTIGDRPADARFGLPRLSPGERIRWLDESLDALRALWRGETVTREGRHVRLDRARVRPAPPPGRPEVAVAGQGPRLLAVAAAHADVWDVNLPAIPKRVAEAAARLEKACRARGRDPAAIDRQMLVFTRVDVAPEDALAEFRRTNPWFREVPDAEIRGALVTGPGPACRERLAALARELDLALPIADLAGLPTGAAARTLEALAPARVDAGARSP